MWLGQAANFVPFVLLALALYLILRTSSLSFYFNKNIDGELTETRGDANMRMYWVKCHFNLFISAQRYAHRQSTTTWTTTTTNIYNVGCQESSAKNSNLMRQLDFWRRKQEKQLARTLHDEQSNQINCFTNLEFCLLLYPRACHRLQPPSIHMNWNEMVMWLVPSLLLTLPIDDQWLLHSSSSSSKKRKRLSRRQGIRRWRRQECEIMIMIRNHACTHVAVAFFKSENYSLPRYSFVIRNSTSSVPLSMLVCSFDVSECVQHFILLLKLMCDGWQCHLFVARIVCIIII